MKILLGTDDFEIPAIKLQLYYCGYSPFRRAKKVCCVCVVPVL